MKRFLYSLLVTILATAAAAAFAYAIVISLAGYCSDYGATDDGATTHAVTAPVSTLAEMRSSNYVQSDEGDDWIDDFICDIRATDVVLAFAAVFLVAIGAWYGAQLNRAIAAMSAAARSARTSAEAAKAVLESDRASPRPPEDGKT
jgi:hypothetical protein